MLQLHLSYQQFNCLLKCDLCKRFYGRNKFQWNLNLNSIIFIQENAFENVVCQNGGHLSRGRWVKQFTAWNWSWYWGPQIFINTGPGNILFPDGIKLSHVPMLINCQVYPVEQTSEQFESIYNNIHSIICIWKCLQNIQLICSGLNVLITLSWEYHLMTFFGGASHWCVNLRPVSQRFLFSKTKLMKSCIQYSLNVICVITTSICLWWSHVHDSHYDLHN